MHHHGEQWCARCQGELLAIKCQDEAHGLEQVGGHSGIAGRDYHTQWGIVCEILFTVPLRAQAQTQVIERSGTASERLPAVLLGARGPRH